MMDHFDVTLANRRKPWDVTDWADGQTRPLVESYATATEMLEAAGLAGMNVQLRPEYTMDHDGAFIPVPGRFATVNSKGRVLGSGLSKRYKVLQMEDAFAFGDAIVDSGEAKWERAGQVRQGETAFGCMELSHLDITVPGDDGGALRPYLLIVNSFGGWTPYSGILAFIRPVCVNTFQAAYGTKTKHKFSIRHTGTLDGKLQMARDAIGIAFKHAEDVKELTTTLATRKVVDAQVAAIFKAAWPSDSADTTKVSAGAKGAMELYESSPTLAGIRGTAWGALNAVTEYVDHIQAHKPKDGGSASELRGLNIMLETGEATKERALRGLLALR